MALAHPDTALARAVAAGRLVPPAEPLEVAPGRRLRVELVRPEELDRGAAEALVDELHRVHSRSYAELDRATFRGRILPERGGRTRLGVVRDLEGRAVGYLALHLCERRIDGRDALIVRSAAALDREAQVADLVDVRLLAQTLRALMGHWRRRILLIAPIADPEIYGQLHRHADRVWPSPGRATPAAIGDLLRDLADDAGLRRVDDADPLRRAFGRRRVATHDEEARWHRDPRPEVRYFVNRNPRFGAGEALVTLVPLRASGLVRALLRLAVGRLHGLWGRLRGRAVPRRRSLAGLDRREP